MSGVKSALLVGVGGQGAILISKIMANGFMQAGFDVKQSEVHGMAQRGGSVSTQVRWGDKVYGPVFGKGEADILVALEKMEAVRYAEFLKPGGVAVINDYAIKSTTIASGAETYPEGCVEAMAKVFRTIAVPASDMALELGNPKCMNVVLFGAMCDSLGCPQIDWEQVVADTVPEKVRELNLRAFRAGRQAALTEEILPDPHDGIGCRMVFGKELSGQISFAAAEFYAKDFLKAGHRHFCRCPAFSWHRFWVLRFCSTEFCRCHFYFYGFLTDAYLFAFRCLPFCFFDTLFHTSQL